MMDVPELGSVFYLCDPVKNTECKKGGCTGEPSPFGVCRLTKNSDFAKLDDDGNPIVGAWINPITGKKVIFQAADDETDR